MSKKKVAFVDQNIPYLADALKAHLDVFEFFANNLTREELIRKDAEILISRSPLLINEELLSRTKIKNYASATSGSNHVDFDYLNEKQIQYFIAKGCNANSVAEYVLYAINSFFDYAELNNKTIGIIGFGNIGKLVAEYSNILGLKVLINDPPLKQQSFNFPNNYEYAELNDLITKSDIITNHVPLSKKGRNKSFNLINDKLINLIKQNSLFIHASRGGIVDELSLLNRNDIFKVIDVWENEPNIYLNLLKSSDLSTPHIAGHSLQGKVNSSFMIADWLSNQLEYTFNIDLELPILTEFNHTNSENMIAQIQKNRLIKQDSCAMKSHNGSPQWFKDYRKDYPFRSETIR